MGVYPVITETDVENYLIKKATKIGALVRKAQWVGHNHCPDRLIMAPHKTVWVEVKAPGKEPRDGQKREHARMRLAGQNVVVIDSKKGVDQFIKDFQEVNSA